MVGDIRDFFFIFLGEFVGFFINEKFDLFGFVGDFFGVEVGVVDFVRVVEDYFLSFQRYGLDFVQSYTVECEGIWIQIGWYVFVEVGIIGIFGIKKIIRS